MIPILSSEQVREVDAYTIKNEPVASIDLMERASRGFVKELDRLAPGGRTIKIFCGAGNNGGDGLAIARILYQRGHRIQVFFIGDVDKASEDFKVNYERLLKLTSIYTIAKAEELPIIEDEIVIDGLFGSGLSRPVEGLYAELIMKINQSGATVFAIDIPSGLFADAPPGKGAIVCADFTISFQTPKLTFFQPASAKYVGVWHLVDIGLNHQFIQSRKTDFYCSERADILLPVRTRFAHKGNAGRLLLVAGSKGKMGAATLAAKAALRSGCGLLFVHTPAYGCPILQVNVPEAMVIEDEHAEIITEISPDKQINVIGIGPGIGTNDRTRNALESLLKEQTLPLVIDADGLNLLSENKRLLKMLPAESILTPHPGEFARLVGKWTDDFERMALLQSFCKVNHVNVVLKGALSAVCDLEGRIFFNPTGNPGMATGGSGDVLTGMISAFLAQSLPPIEALKAAVYTHGLAGDLAMRKRGVLSMIASDIIEQIPDALKNIGESGER